MMRRGLILLGLMMAAACSMAETKIYSIYLPEPGRAQTKKRATVTVKVHSPRYLSQPYIAQRRSDYQLDISRYAKWDSSPVEMVKEAFRDSLSAYYDDVRASSFVPEGAYVLAINLRHFERVDEGHGLLTFTALLTTAEGRELHRIDVEKKVALETKDSAGLAKGLSSAMAEAVKDVSAGISSRL